MEIIRGYGLGPKLQQILQRYWYGQKVCGFPFSTGIGVTQGGAVYLTIFNIVVDAMIRGALLEVCGPQEAQHGFGWVAGDHNTCFYANDGWIVGRNPVWVHISLTAMVIMSERVGLQKNLSNTKAIVGTPGFIWGHQGVEAYKQRAAG